MIRAFRLLLVTFLGLGFGVIAGSVAFPSAEAQTTKVAYVLPGNGTICWGWGQFPSYNVCWHDDEGGSYSALDLQYPSSNPGRPTYWKHYGADTSQTLAVSFSNLSGTNCTGVLVTIGTSGAPGDFHYLHINPASGVIGSSWQSWYSVPGYEEGSRYLGDTATSQPTGCAFDGAHLHQSGNNADTTAIYTNWTVGTSPYCCGLYYWNSATWTHKVMW